MARDCLVCGGTVTRKKRGAHRKYCGSRCLNRRPSEVARKQRDTVARRILRELGRDV